MSESEPSVAHQREVFEQMFASDRVRWAFHDSADPLVRYVRDRRLKFAIRTLGRRGASDVAPLSVLVVCGGVGGEGTFLANAGFGHVTVSDIAPAALQICRERDARLDTLELDAQDLALPEGAFDVVLVQDGLHHLTRPVTGFNEMLRVARLAVVVIEPYESLVGHLLGQTWERQGDAVTYVFRWERRLIRDVARSQLGNAVRDARVMRLWDHSSTVERVAMKGARLLSRDQPPSRDRGHQLARCLYGLLRPLDWCGNNMVAVVMKDPPRSARTRGS